MTDPDPTAEDETPPDASVVLTTVGSAEDARILARRLVDHGAAACVQILPITSVYRWDDTTREDDELLLLVKTPTSSIGEIERLVDEHHPYDVPELLHLGTTGGLPEYLRWMAEMTSGAPDPPQ